MRLREQFNAFLSFSDNRATIFKSITNGTNIHLQCLVSFESTSRLPDLFVPFQLKEALIFLDSTTFISLATSNRDALL